MPRVYRFEGTVYVAWVTLPRYGKCLKIGFTTRTVEKRVSQLKTSFESVEIIKTYPGRSQSCESALIAAAFRMGEPIPGHREVFSLSRHNVIEDLERTVMAQTILAWAQHSRRHGTRVPTLEDSWKDYLPLRKRAMFHKKKGPVISPFTARH